MVVNSTRSLRLKNGTTRNPPLGVLGGRKPVGNGSRRFLFSAERLFFHLAEIAGCMSLVRLIENQGRAPIAGEIGSAGGSGIGTTGWGALVKYQPGVTPAMWIAKGNRPSSLSLKAGAGGYALTLSCCKSESFPCLLSSVASYRLN